MNVIYQSHNILLTFDPSINTVISEWNGEVSYEDFKEGMERTAKHIIEHPKSSIVINFRSLSELSARARVWFEDEYMKEEGRTTFRKCSTVVVVRPMSVLANMITSNFLEVCKRSAPLTRYKECGTVSKAIKMLDPKRSMESGSSFFSLIPQKIRLNWT